MAVENQMLVINGPKYMYELRLMRFESFYGTYEVFVAPPVDELGSMGGFTVVENQHMFVFGHVAQISKNVPDQWV